jgi:hypothetical protein
VNKLIVELAAPPVITSICWLGSRILSTIQRGKIRPMTGVQFWLLLISAYMMFALALWGDKLVASHERDDPSPDLVR